MHTHPTRGNNVLDLIITNLSHLTIAPLGISDYNTIPEWTANTGSPSDSDKKCTAKCFVRRFTRSTREAFGSWCSTHVWFTYAHESAFPTELTLFLPHSRA